MTPNHVHEVAFECAGDPRADFENIFHIVDAIRRGKAADLCFLAEDQKIWLDVVVLPIPPAPRCAKAGLNLVENQQHLVLVGNLPQRGEKFTAEIEAGGFNFKEEITIPGLENTFVRRFIKK